jgi:hypothetical protein
MEIFDIEFSGVITEKGSFLEKKLFISVFRVLTNIQFDLDKYLSVVNKFLGLNYIASEMRHC